MNKVLAIIILVLLVLFSAFFSGSEIVYAKVNPLKLKKKAKKGKSAKMALNIVDNYPIMLSTILVGNNLVNIAASSIATVVAMEVWPQYGELIATLGMTVIILIFGEILPKTIFQTYNYTLSLLFAPILKFFYYLFKPVVWLFTKIINSLSKLWTPKEDIPTATDEELINMVDEIEDEGYIDEDTGELIKSAIDFTDVDAYEIMQHRVDVFAFDIEDDVKKLINDENIFNFSRVPVYEGSMDEIIGVLSTRQLLIKLLKKEKIDNNTIRSMLTQPLYIHKTKSVSSLLHDFKKTQTHIAVVKDEFGGTMGIVTLEDVLEELVGEIWDETDKVEEEYTKKNDNTYIVEGDMNIYDLWEMLNYQNDEFDTEYITVGGFCTEKLEKFPSVNDTFTFENFKFTILEVDEDGVRVEKVSVEVLEKDEDEED